MDFKNIPIIECSSFVLRPVNKYDALDMYEYGTDTEVVKFMPWGPFNDLEEVSNVIETVFLNRPERGIPYAYAIEYKKNGKMIGTCDFHSLNIANRSGEIGFCLNRDYWGLGIMTEAVKNVIKFGFEYLNLERIQVCHAEDNTRSQRVIEKAGFRYEGLLRNYLNIKGVQKNAQMYAIIQNDLL